MTMSRANEGSQIQVPHTPEIGDWCPADRVGQEMVWKRKFLPKEKRMRPEGGKEK